MIIELPANAARVCRVAGFQVLFAGFDQFGALFQILQGQPLVGRETAERFNRGQFHNTIAHASTALANRNGAAFRT